jgi:altronate dehydratase small subunit
MKPRCFQIHERDNVATMIGDAMNGAIEVIGKDAGEIIATERIASGQKIALREIAKDEAIVKFGVRIGHATAPIRCGAWVHLHNLASDIDERSGTLDLHSGAPTDTRYE